jgi:hypothetical protein
LPEVHDLLKGGSEKGKLMLEDNRKRILAGLLTVLGAVLAFFVVRNVVRRVGLRVDRQKQRRADEEQQLRASLQSQTGEIAQGQEAPRYQPQDQPDRQPIPTTGAEAAAPVTADMASEVVEERKAVDLDQQVTSLLQYLLTFRDFIAVVRERRKESSTSIRSLTSQDRDHFQEALDRLAPDLEGYAEGNVEGNPLQKQIYRLTVKVQDAMQNLEYLDDDLFRIHGEVRTEACRLLQEIKAAGAKTGKDFERVRKEYEC